MKKELMVKRIFNASVLVISVVLIIYFCVSEDGLLDLAKNIHQFKKTWLFLAVMGMLGDLFLDAGLIYLFTKSGEKRYTLRKALKSGIVGHFYSAVTPFQSGGQPMQIYIMTKQGVDPAVSTSAMIQKFLVYQTCLTAYSAFAIAFCFQLFSGSISGGFWGIALIGFLVQAAVIVALVLFSFNRDLTHRILVFFCRFLYRIHILSDDETAVENLEEVLDRFHESNHRLYQKKKLLLCTYVLTFFQQTCLFSVSYCIYRAFNFEAASPIEMICAQAFVTMVSSMVPLPGAAGASEGSFYVFLSMFFTSGTIKSATLLWRIITYYAVIMITAPFSRITKKMQKECEKEGRCSHGFH